MSRFYLILVWVVSTVCLLPNGILAADPPTELIESLKAPEFEAREVADVRLRKWAGSQGEEGLISLLNLSRGHEAAEVRVRCFEALRDAVGSLYEAQGQGYMGVSMIDQMVAIPGLAMKQVPVVMIDAVIQGSAAEEAGLRRGDLIYELNGKDWSGLAAGRAASDDIRNRIQNMKPGTEVHLGVLRGKKRIRFRLVLRRRPAMIQRVPMGAANREMQDEISRMEHELRDSHFKKWLLEHGAAQ